MSNAIFEAHLLTNKSLPFIFNSDYADKYIDIIPNNWHPNIEILFFTGGTGSVILGEQTINVKSGDMVIINSNVAHSITADKKVYYYYLIPDNEFCLQNGIDTDNIKFSSYINDKTASELYQKCIGEFETKTSVLRNAGIRAAVLNLLVYIGRHYATAIPDKEKKELTKGINFSIGYILSHINDKLTVDDLCYQAGLSKYYFVRQFKKTTGYTPIAFINITRCENAKKLLSQGDLSLAEIAEKSGFETTSYFIKTFKKYNGETPGKILREAQKK